MFDPAPSPLGWPAMKMKRSVCPPWERSVCPPVARHENEKIRLSPLTAKKSRSNGRNSLCLQSDGWFIPDFCTTIFDGMEKVDNKHFSLYRTRKKIKIFILNYLKKIIVFIRFSSKGRASLYYKLLQNQKFHLKKFGRAVIFIKIRSLNLRSWVRFSPRDLKK